MNSKFKENDYPLLVFDNPDKKIYSRAFLRSVLLNLPVNEPTTIIYLDCARIDELNNKYGFNTVTSLMYGVQDVLQELLLAKPLLSNKPVNLDPAKFARDGGDEFCIIMPTRILRQRISSFMSENESATNSKEKRQFMESCLELLSKKDLNFDQSSSGLIENVLNYALLSNGLYTNGLTITAGCSECMPKQSLHDTLDRAQMQVKERKLNSVHLISEKTTPEQILAERIKEYARKHWSTFRIPHDKTISLSVMHSYIELINQELEKILEKGDFEYISPVDSPKAKFPSFSPEECIAFNEYITLRSENPDLSPKPPENIDKLYELLSTNILTGLPNATYFERYLLNDFENLNTQFIVMCFHATGIKLSNEINGYSVTDTNLAKAGKDIQEFLLNISDNPFLVDRKGGDFLAILSDSANVPQSDLEKVRSSNKDNVLRYVYYSSRCDSQTLKSTIDKASKSCFDGSSNIKIEVLFSKYGIEYLDKLLMHTIKDLQELFGDNWEEHIPFMCRNILDEIENNFKMHSHDER